MHGVEMDVIETGFRGPAGRPGRPGLQTLVG